MEGSDVYISDVGVSLISFQKNKSNGPDTSITFLVPKSIVLTVEQS